MMRALTLNAVSDSLGQPIVGDDVSFSTVSTDSRQLAENALFVALSGENFDGNQFVSQAKTGGAVAALVSRPVDCSIPHIVVDDTRLALAKVAGMNRESFSGKLVAITGSAGKTSCKELIASVLNQHANTLATKANFNNEIGVPLTLLALSPEYEYAVIEMGARKVGDIQYLCEFAKPDVSLITNIMPAHLDGFGDINGVATGKSEIFFGMQANGIAIVNLDEPYSEGWLSKLQAKHISYLTFALNNSKANVFAADIQQAPEGVGFELNYGDKKARVNLSLAGEHSVRNALAAAVVALSLNLPIERVVAGLQSVQPTEGRLQRLVGPHGCVVINDCYNANPGSVSAAISTLAQYSGERCLVMGDMGELGNEVSALHKRVAEEAKSKGIDLLFTVGANAQLMAEAFGKGAIAFASQQALLDHCLNSLTKNSVVLVKGSRSAKMETIVNGLVNSDVTLSDTTITAGHRGH